MLDVGLNGSLDILRLGYRIEISKRVTSGQVSKAKSVSDMCSYGLVDFKSAFSVPIGH